MTWPENSLYEHGAIDLSVIFASIASGIILLMHSFYLHGKTWTGIRAASDMASLALILQAVSIWPCAKVFFNLPVLWILLRT
jgi:hypothetical protein